MKKLLGVLLVMTLSWPVSATVLKNVEVVGEIQTIASDVHHNHNTAIYNTNASARVLAGLSADLVEDVTANSLFQYANVWGNDSAAGKDVNTYWGEINLVNANVALHNLFCAFDLTVGRQFYGDEDSAVMYFGPNHYNAEFNGYTRSVDAAKLTYADDVKAFTFIAGRVNASALGAGRTGMPAPAAGVGLQFFGADFSLNMTEAVKAQVYGYDVRNTNMFGVADEDAGFYGAKLAADMEAFRASVEYARNFGGDRLIKEHKGTGHMLKADVAADLEKVTARGTFMYANEHFFALGNYTPGLLVGQRLGGNIYNYSVEGISLFNVGFDFNPAEKWVLSLDGYSFQDHRLDHSATLEADLTAKYNHNEYVQLFAGVGYAKYTKTAAANVPVFNKAVLGADNVKGQLGMLIKF